MIKDHDSLAIFQEKEDNRITYHLDSLEADKYLSQFLNAEDLDLQSYQKQYQGSEIQPIVLSIKQETRKGVKYEEGEKKQTKKYSCFQNFQKHLVITIRSIVDTSKLGKSPETAQCQKNLWKIFLNSNKINKTLVSLIVGDITCESIAKITEYGFNKILEDYSLFEIKESQQNIRQQVLIQLKKANLDEEIQKRRLKNKRQFVVYFHAFIAELENGDLDKRMSKCTKLLKSQFL